MNMKNILKLMGALAITTGATTSVVACNESTNATMNAAISKILDLTNDKGEGVQEISLDTSKTDQPPVWTIPALVTAITADKLLTEENKAANQACFDFITNVFKVKPTKGTKLDDGIFEKSVLTAITGQVTKITPTLKKTEDGKDYAITAGTFSFQFKKGEEKIGDVYSFNLKIDAKKGIIGTVLAALVTNFTVSDTDLVDNNNFKFVKDGPIPAGAVKGAVINIDSTTENGKMFAALNKLTGLKVTAQMESTNASGTWDAGKILTISYKTSDVNFDASTVKTDITVPN